jgi:guanylate kinase
MSAIRALGGRQRGHEGHGRATSDVGAAGANYGWPITEGPTQDPRFVSPLYAYKHDVGCAITGGTFYRPAVQQFPSQYVGDYFFVDRPGFEKLKDGDLIEWAEVHGQLYGTRRAYVDAQLAAGLDVLLNIDIQGGDRVKRVFPGAVMVFILPPSFADLEQRLRGRGDLAATDFQVRLAAARIEIGASARYDYLVVNDDLERAGGDLKAIIMAERCRRERAVADMVRRLID